MYGVSSFPDYEDVLRAAAIGDAAASTVKRISLEEGGDIEPLLGEVVTGNYFSVTGLQPLLGRAFLPEEGAPASGSAVAILGYDLWKERFGGDAGIIGRSVRLNGHPVTIVGVTPEGVLSRRVPVRPDVWLPLGAEQLTGRSGALNDRGGREYVILARLADGAELPELQAQLSVLGTRLAGEYPDAWKDDRGQDRTFTAVAERDSRVNPRARGILAVVAGFFFVATGPRPAHRVHQRDQPVPGAGRAPTARGRRAARAGCGTAPDRRPPAGRGAVAGRGGGCGRVAVLGDRGGRDGVLLAPRQRAAAAGLPPERARLRLRLHHGPCNQPGVQPGPGREGLAAGSGDGPQVGTGIGARIRASLPERERSSSRCSSRHRWCSS